MEHLSDRQILDYRDGALASLDEEASAERHIAECADCSGRLRASDVAPPPDLMRALVGEAHPSDEVIARYSVRSETVSGRVRRHVEQCPRCQADVAELRAFRAAWQFDAPAFPPDLRAAPRSGPVVPRPRWALGL